MIIIKRFWFSPSFYKLFVLTFDKLPRGVLECLLSMLHLNFAQFLFFHSSNRLARFVIVIHFLFSLGMSYQN
jgi:hypothetical protein